MKRVALGLIHFYQRSVSPGLAPSCRFEPSCSHYGYEAIDRYGLLKGVWLSMRRVARCHPLHARSYDPVP